MSVDVKVTIEFGESSKEFLADLAGIVDQAAKADSKKNAKAGVTTDVVSPKKVVKKEEENFDLGDSEPATEDEAPSLTIKECIAAAKENRELAVKVLKRLKVKSIHDLKPGQYPRFMEEVRA